MKPDNPSDASAVALPVMMIAPYAVTSSRPTASSSLGAMPSRDRNPCMCAAGALRGSPASTTTTDRRARDKTSAADSPAGPPPMIATS